MQPLNSHDYRRNLENLPLTPNLRSIFDKVGIVYNPSAFFGKFGDVWERVGFSTVVSSSDFLGKKNT